MKKVFTLLMVAVLCAGLSLQAKPTLKAMAAKSPVSGLSVKLTKGMKAPAKAADDNAVYDAYLEDFNTIFYPNYLADYFVATGDCSDDAYEYAFEVWDYCYELSDLMTAAYYEGQETGEYVSPLTQDILDELDDHFLNLAILVFPDFWDDYVAGFELIDKLTELAEEYPEYKQQLMRAANAVDDALYDVEDALYAAVEEAAFTAYYEDYDPITGYVTPESYTEAVADADAAINRIYVAIDYAADREQLDEIVEAYVDYEDPEDIPAYALVHADEIAAVGAKVDALSEAISAAYQQALVTGVYDGPASGEFMAVTEAVLGLIADVDEAYLSIINGFYDDYNTLDELIAFLNPYLDEEIECTDEQSFAAGDIAGKIHGLLEECRKAQAEALEVTCVYVSPLTDEVLTAIKSEIDALLSTDGIKSVSVDANAAVYFDLNGKAVANPAAGKVYIRVANGKATKIVK